MNEILLTTKESGSKPAGIVGGILFLLVGILFPIMFAGVFSGDIPTEMISTLIGLSIFFIAFGTIFIVINVLFSKSYADFYGNHIEGKYISKQWGINNFYVDNNDVINISVNSSWLYIKTLNETYKIRTNKSTADKVFKYYSNNMQNN